MLRLICIFIYHSILQDETSVISKAQLHQLDEQGEIIRNFNRPVVKDSFMVPNGGYIVGKFRADNPGPWFFHCHNELHVEQGMSMVIEVGKPDEWPQDDKNFYQCGHYKAQNKSKGKQEDSPIVSSGEGLRAWSTIPEFLALSVILQLVT